MHSLQVFSEHADPAVGGAAQITGRAALVKLLMQLKGGRMGVDAATDVTLKATCEGTGSASEGARK